jgi:hypothetical protein
MAASIEGAVAEGRLEQSRNELRQMMVESEERRAKSGYFPRSKTMRMLAGGGGATLLAIGASTLLLLKPQIAKSALKVLPVNMIVRMLAVKFLTRGR